MDISEHFLFYFYVYINWYVLKSSFYFWYISDGNCFLFLLPFLFLLDIEGTLSVEWGKQKPVISKFLQQGEPDIYIKDFRNFLSYAQMFLKARCLYFAHFKLKADGLIAEVLCQITRQELHWRQCFIFAVLLGHEHHGQGWKLSNCSLGRLVLKSRGTG